MIPLDDDVALLIGERLKERRLELGWSRKRLGERAAVSPETLRAFERSGQVSLRRLIRLATSSSTFEVAHRAHSGLISPFPRSRSLSCVIP